MTWCRLPLITLALIALVGCGAAAPAARGTPPPPATPSPAPQPFRLEGVIERGDDDTLQIDGVPVGLNDATRSSNELTPGAWATVRGVVTPDGERIAEEIEIVNDTLIVAGPIERLDGEIWVIDGAPVQVVDATRLDAALAPGTVVRAVVRRPAALSADGWTPVALQITPLRESVVVGVVTRVEDTLVVLDDREIVLGPDAVLDSRVVVGSVARVTIRYADDDDDGPAPLRLIARAVALVPAAVVVEGPLERIEDGGWLVVGGQRLQLGSGVLLTRAALVIGAPLRIVVVQAQTLVVLAITVVQVIVAPEIAIIEAAPPPPPATAIPLPPQPVATARPVVVIVQPRPVQPAPAPQRGGDDDDDDDDDD